MKSDNGIEFMSDCPISKLVPYKRNPRLNDQAVKAVSESIGRFGAVAPIIVDKDFKICAGHTRYKAALERGKKTFPVLVVPHLVGDEFTAYNIADNQTATIADWDMPELAAIIKELEATEFPVDVLGFDDKELQNIVDSVSGNASLTDPDDVPEVPEEPVVKTGDLWLLENHRLLCGDSTKAEDVERLMGGEQAAIVFTDPPYGVSYDGGTTVRDRLAGDDSTALYAPCCTMAFRFSTHDAPLYLWHAGIKGIAAAAAGYEIRCEIVWNKNLAQYGALSSQYKQKHEPCYYCYKHGQTVNWCGPTNEVTVWDCDRAQKNEYHPTQKPVAIAVRALHNHAALSVLDLFGGSGSTIIAAEQLGRKAYCLEIEPRYVQVSLERWAAFTGKMPVLERTGKTLAELKTEQVTA